MTPWLPSPSPAPSLLTCRSLQPRAWPAWPDKGVQNSCLMAYEINKWAFGAQSHLMASKQVGVCGSPGPQAARQQGSKAARQQGSKAARQQGNVVEGGNGVGASKEITNRPEAGSGWSARSGSSRASEVVDPALVQSHLGGRRHQSRQQGDAPLGGVLQRHQGADGGIVAIGPRRHIGR